MDSETKKKLEATIVVCAERAICINATALDALQYTQAALNAAHALSVFESVKIKR